MAVIGSTVTTQSVGPSQIPVVGYSSGFFVVQAPRGEAGVVKRCASFGQFLRYFGGLDRLVTLAAGTAADTWSYETSADVVQGYYGVKAFFENKGSGSPGIAYVVRATQTASPPTAATKNFPDATVNNTAVTSKWLGTHGGTTLVTVTNPSPVKGTGFAQFRVEFSRASIVEYWEIANAADAADASRRSELVTITLPAGLQLPVTAAQSKIGNAPGTQGTADAYAATAANYVGTLAATGARTGLKCFEADKTLGSGMVAFPGKYDSTSRAALLAHAATYNRVAYLGGPSALDQSSVVTDKSTNAGDGMYYWPQMLQSDENTGGTLLVDPVGYVMGMQARMDRDYGGPHKSAAGVTHPIYGAIDVERQSNGMEKIDDDVVNTLADSFINCIRGNKGIYAFGLRTLSTDNRYRQSNVMRTVKMIQATLFEIGSAVAMEPIDSRGRLFSRLKSDCSVFLEGLRAAGALYGTEPGKDLKPTDAYFVFCDEGNNTVNTLSQGQVVVDVVIKPTTNAEQIRFNLFVAAPGAFATRP